jgi:hypothetical protein
VCASVAHASSRRISVMRHRIALQMGRHKLNIVRSYAVDPATISRLAAASPFEHGAVVAQCSARGWFDPAGSDKRSPVANFLRVQPTPFQIRTNFFQPVTYVTGICGPSRVRLYVQ